MFRQILLLLVALSSQSTQGEKALAQEDGHTLYVVPENYNCSSLPLNRGKSVCHPLSFYVENVTQYFTNNTVMVFTAGKHQLPLPPRADMPVVNVTGITNFSMIGNGTINYSEERAPLPSSIILCNYNDTNQPRNGILFYKTNAIHIENLTIEDCGAKFTVQRPDYFPLVSALTYRESYDVNLTQVRIDGSLGFGLDADRIFGSFRVSNSVFVRSTAYRLGLNKNVGGNAKFWYSEFHPPAGVVIQSTTLSIHNSWFMYGQLNNEKHYRGFNFSSGLIILIYIPSVNVTIDSVIVKNNTGTHGGNMAIQITDYHENTSTIAISNSVIANGSAVRGGGIQFWVQVQQNYSQKIINSRTHFIMNVSNTIFTGNSAGESGGGIYIGHYASRTKDFIVRHISFKGCKFMQNSVLYRKGVTRSYSGAAIQVIKHNIDDFVPHNVPQYMIDFQQCVFESNQLKDITNEGGIVDFVSTQSITVTNCSFTFNIGTAISLRQSNIKFFGTNNIFKGNTGTHGGAMKFCELSKMYLPSYGVKIDFIGNSAKVSGGAIYVSQQLCLETAPPCFFQPIREIHSSIDDLHIKLHFQNNTALIAGDVVYGGQVDHCFLYYSHYDNHSTYISKRVFDKIFDLTEQRESLSNLSSYPYGACFYDNIEGKLECHNKSFPTTGVVYPGQHFNFYVAAVGQRNGISPASSGFFYFVSELDNSSNPKMKCQELPTQRKQYATLNCTVYSNQPNATFSLRIQQVSQAEVTQRYIHYDFKNLTVNLGECPWGFVLTKSLLYECVCDNLLTEYGVPCNIDTQIVTRWGFYWLGCTNSYQSKSVAGEGESGTNVDTKYKGLCVAVRCVRDYCRTDRRNVSSSTLDDQCSEGREGTICGQCKQNYSLALGTSRCLTSCPAYMVYIIVISSAVSGILLILFLIVCNFTISEGTINGLLFYAHVVHSNSSFFFPGRAGTSNTNVFRLFIAWLNLDMGLEVCFYKSMTQYQKVWLDFSFLFYIWFLEYLIIFLSRRYIFFTRLVGRNVVKVLATLGLVCFPKLFNIALSSLEFAYLHHSNGHQTTVWQLDGNLRYLSGKHIPLFILGIVLTLIALSYTFALLFIQCLQKQSRLYCFGWVNRLRPFFEAHTGPCHVYYRFWPGCLFFTRLVLITLCSLLINKDNISLYIIIAACVVLLIIALVLPNAVYRRWPLNVLETTFFLNLGIVSGLTGLLGHPKKGPARTQYFVYPSVSLTMVLFSGVLLYHCAKQLRSYPCCQKLKLPVISGILNRRLKCKRFRRPDIQSERHEQEETEPFLRQDMQDIVDSSQYREVLIED